MWEGGKYSDFCFGFKIYFYILMWNIRKELLGLKIYFDIVCDVMLFY